MKLLTSILSFSVEIYKILHVFLVLQLTFCLNFTLNVSIGQRDGFFTLSRILPHKNDDTRGNLYSQPVT